MKILQIKHTVIPVKTGIFSLIFLLTIGIFLPLSAQQKKPNPNPEKLTQILKEETNRLDKVITLKNDTISKQNKEIQRLQALIKEAIKNAENNKDKIQSLQNQLSNTQVTPPADNPIPVPTIIGGALRIDNINISPLYRHRFVLLGLAKQKAKNIIRIDVSFDIVENQTDKLNKQVEITTVCLKPSGKPYLNECKSFSAIYDGGRYNVRCELTSAEGFTWGTHTFEFYSEGVKIGSAQVEIWE